MKYRGVEEVTALSIREYLGFFDGSDMWIHNGYAIGVKKDGIMCDYITGLPYNFIDRDSNGNLLADRNNAVIGEIYAVRDGIIQFKENKMYSDKEIDKIIKTSGRFNKSYINSGVNPKIKIIED